MSTPGTLAADLRAAFTLRSEFDQNQRERIPASLQGGKYLISPGVRIGTGGLGDVYEGKVPATGLRVAVKFLLGSAFWPEQLADQALDEVRHLARIAEMDSKSVVIPLDAGRDPVSGLVYIVMSRANGRPLHRVPDGELSAERLELWMQHAARAIQACHDLKTRHGDLKPSNILVEDSGEVSVIDFGFSVLLGATTDTHGYTPGYESPEQWRGGRGEQSEEIGLSSDVYSFGVVFHEAWARWEAAGPRRSVPAPIRALLGRCLCEEPGGRPSASEVSRELAALARRRRRLLRGMAVVGLIAAVTALAFAGRTWDRHQEAERQRNEAERQRTEAEAQRDRLIDQSRQTRSSYYDHVLTPSAHAVKEIRLLGRPSEQKLKTYRTQVEDFRANATGTPYDGLVLLLADTQLALFEGRLEPPGVHDPGWDDIALALKPSVRADLYEVRGLCLERGRKPAAARECYDRALVLAPDRTGLHYRLADCWDAEKEYHKAETELSRFLIAGATDSSDAVRERVLRDAHWFRASIRLVRLTDPRGAYQDMADFFVRHATADVRLDDAAMSDAHRTQADAAYLLGRDEEAARLFSTAADLRIRSAATTKDRLFIADCYTGIVIALGSLRPDEALNAARKAEEHLPADIPPGPLRMARARIALHRGLARLHLKERHPDDVRLALADLAAAEKQYAAVGDKNLTDDEMYEYALTMVTRAGNPVGPNDPIAQLNLSRRGVKLMTGPAGRHPRYQTSLVPAAVALVAILANEAIRPGERAQVEREAMARESSEWCKQLESQFGGLMAVVYDPGTLLFLRCSHRAYWTQAAAVLRDPAEIVRQGQALIDLCSAPNQQTLIAEMPPGRQRLIQIWLGVAATESARHYLRSPTEPAAVDVRRSLAALLALAPPRATWLTYAAAAAAHSSVGDFCEATRLQQRAITIAPGTSVTRLRHDLQRYELGLAYEP